MSETIIENLTNYELMLILPPGLGEEASLKELAEIKNIITADAGEIFHEDVWGIKEFAYTIKKHDEGFYIVLNFKVEGNKINELEKELNLNQKVIRYLISKTPKHYEIKTLEDYQAIAAKEAAEKEKDEKSTSKAKTTPKPKKAVVKEELKKIPKEEVAEEKVEKVEEVVEEKVEEVAEEKEEKVEEKVEEVAEEKVEEVAEEKVEEVAEEKVEEVAEKKVEEVAEKKVEEVAEKKVEGKKDEKTNLADLDEKLQSIINDPDISL